MMAETGETATATTTTTRTTMAQEAAPANLNSSSDSNFSADSTCDHCSSTCDHCSSARIWTFLILCWKLVAGAYDLVKTHVERARTKSTGKDRDGGWTPLDIWLWVVPPLLILYCVVLFGIIKDKLGLITLYAFWMCLEVVVVMGIFIHFGAKHFSDESILKSLLVNSWVIYCAFRYRQQLAWRKSQSLQSEGTAFDSP